MPSKSGHLNLKLEGSCFSLMEHMFNTAKKARDGEFILNHGSISAIQDLTLPHSFHMLQFVEVIQKMIYMDTVCTPIPICTHSLIL